MGFPFFPFTNFHEINMDWVIKFIKKAKEELATAKQEVDEAVEIVEGYDERLEGAEEDINRLELENTAQNATIANLGDRLNSMNTGLTDLAAHAVQTYEQYFSDAEQAQARANIGAVALSAYNSNNNRVNAILEYQGNQISALAPVTFSLTDDGNWPAQPIPEANRAAILAAKNTLVNKTTLVYANITQQTHQELPSGFGVAMVCVGDNILSGTYEKAYYDGVNQEYGTISATITVDTVHWTWDMSCKVNSAEAPPYVTPEMFGATGDGVADDTNALQQCIQNGANIILTGTYKISSPLSFNQRNNITMSGGKIVRSANQTFNTIVGNDASNIHLVNITLDGNGNDRNMEYTWPMSIQAAIILASQCKNIFVEKCKIVNHNYGVFILGADTNNENPSYENTSMNGVIRDCVFHNCNAAIDTYGKGVTIEHNIFYGNTAMSVRAEGNNQTQTYGNPFLDDNYYTAETGCTISNNLFLDNQSPDIQLYNNSYGVAVYGNTHINYEQAVLVNATDCSRGIEIHSNIYLYQKQQTIDANKRPYQYTATAEIQGDIYFHDNIIQDVYVGVYTKGACTIKNNHFSRSSIAAITAYEASSETRKLIVDGNIIQGHEMASGAWWGCYAVSIFTANSLVLFTNNTIFTEDTRPMYVVSGTPVYVKNLLSNKEPSTVTKPTGLYEYTN